MILGWLRRRKAKIPTDEFKIVEYDVASPYRFKAFQWHRSGAGDEGEWVHISIFNTDNFQSEDMARFVISRTKARMQPPAKAVGEQHL